jgi:small subunit ribosomal protein S21
MNLVVEVFDNDVNTALLKLKRAAQRTGLLREIKRRTFYLPPGECRRLKSQRARKAARKRARQYRVRLDGNGDPI